MKDELLESLALNSFRARVKMEFCRHRYLPHEKESPPETSDPPKQTTSMLLHTLDLHLQETS
jgi:hypothetical protein